jgi:CubicO group peptidase (beta-lactamase class C family)
MGEVYTTARVRCRNRDVQGGEVKAFTRVADTNSRTRGFWYFAAVWLALAGLFVSHKFVLAAPQENATPPMAKPEAVGFSAELPQKIRDAVQQHLDKGDVPGVIVLVARNNRVAYWDAQGVLDAKTKAPLAKDTVFWVASMTKPIVTTSILMMMEAGKLSIEDPVSKFIPEFKAPAQVRVLKPGSPAPSATPGPPDPNAPKPQYDLVPASRPITIKDLLTHTSGIQSIGVAKDSLPPVQQGDTLSTWVPKLATVPLDFQPGSKWAYSNAAGFDVLARIVEVTSGQPFNQFVQQRIFDPLGIKDSGFGPRKDLESRTMTLPGTQALSPCVSGTTFFCGSAGLWMPADDYWRFSEMLLNKGEVLHGKRLLKASSVELMGSNQIGNLFAGFGGIPATGVGFGLSVEVVTDQAASKLALPNGSFGWNGVGTRQFWVVPSEKLVIVMYVPSGNAAAVHRDIESAVMSSIRH